MRLAIIVSTFPPYHGGMGNVAEQEARFLALGGHEVVVFVPRGTERRLENSEKLPYKIVELASLINIGNAAVVPALIMALRGFDVAHLHFPFFGGALFAVLGARLNRVRLTLTYHMDADAEGWRGFIFKILLRSTGAIIFSSAEKIRVSSFDYARTSRYLAPTLERQPQKFFEIPFAPPEPRESTNSLTPILPAKGYFIFVGGMDRAHAFKNIPLLLRAFRLAYLSLPEKELVLVGDGQLRADYEELARKEGIQNRVKFLGYLHDHVLTLALARAEALILPSTSRAEAFGLVLLQAFSAGTPVIVFDIPGVRSIVTSAVGWRVPTNDPTALALVMQKVSQNSKENYQPALRSCLREIYNAERVSRQLLSFIEFGGTIL